jgi:hypothetical protein
MLTGGGAGATIFGSREPDLAGSIEPDALIFATGHSSKDETQERE